MRIDRRDRPALCLLLALAALSLGTIGVLRAQHEAAGPVGPRPTQRLALEWAQALKRMLVVTDCEPTLMAELETFAGRCSEDDVVRAEFCKVWVAAVKRDIAAGRLCD